MSAITWEQALERLSPHSRAQVVRNEPLSRHTTLRVGGPAEFFLFARDLDTMAEVAALGQELHLQRTAIQRRHDADQLFDLMRLQHHATPLAGKTYNTGPWFVPIR